MSDLPSNHLYDLPTPPTPEIAKSDLPSNRLYNLPPPNCQVQFTLKSSVQFTLKSSVRFTPPKIAKSDLPSNFLYDLPPLKLPSPIYPQIVCTIYPPKSPSPIGGVNRTDDLRVNRTWQFRWGGKSSNIFHQVNTFHHLS